MKKREEKQIEKESWIYTLLLAVLAILWITIKDYTFQVLEISFSFSLFLLPFTYFLVKNIIKKCGYKRAILSIVISTVAFVCFSALSSFALKEVFDLSNVKNEFYSYLGSQLIFVSIYRYLIEEIEDNIFISSLNYLFATIIYHMISTFVGLEKIQLNLFLLKYFLTLGIQAVICFFIAFIEKKYIKK